MPKQAKPSRKWRNGEVREVRYHPHGKPIPLGWTPTESLKGTHHGHHALLLVKDDENGTPKRKKIKPAKSVR